MKILLIEDNSDHAELSRLALEPQFKVDWVKSGEEGWQYLKTLTPDNYPAVILMDYSLPLTDGLVLLERITREEYDIPVIMVTGRGDEKVAVESMKKGAYDYVVKEENYLITLSSVILGTIKRHETVREKTRLEQEMKRLVVIDELTGLFNRRYFSQKMEEEVTRAKRHKTKLVLIMLDIDNFKDFNDNSGHLEGDKVLKEVGNIILHSIRDKIDSGCRYGGDEFAVILPGTEKNHASAVAKRIRKMIQEKRINNLGISAGIAEFDRKMITEDLIRSADEALYRAKKIKEGIDTN